MSGLEPQAHRLASSQVSALPGMWGAGVCLSTRECTSGQARPGPPQASTEENQDASFSSSFLSLAPLSGASSQNPPYLPACL